MTTARTRLVSPGASGPETSAALRSLRADLEANPPRRFPRLRGVAFASVAIALSPGATVEDARVVLIGRANRPGDRWSGDIAFPGGFASKDDASGLVTARREAREEVGLELGEPIGTLSDRVGLGPGGRRFMRVRPFVFALDAETPLVADPREVAAVYRPSLGELETMQRSELERRFGPLRHRFEARSVGDHLLWGLTADLLRELRLRIARGTGTR